MYGYMHTCAHQHALHVCLTVLTAQVRVSAVELTVARDTLIGAVSTVAGNGRSEGGGGREGVRERSEGHTCSEEGSIYRFYNTARAYT